jgi:hypothetical protein
MCYRSPLRRATSVPAGAKDLQPLLQEELEEFRKGSMDRIAAASSGLVGEPS